VSEHPITADTATKRMLGAVVAWNVFDIGVHVAVDEVEMLRVTANVVLIAVAIAVLVGRAGPHPAHPLVPALFACVALNLVVLIDKGPAAPMITFVVASIVLTAAAIERLRPAPEQREIRIGRR